jgi:protein-tyrosine phosphatase
VKDVCWIAETGLAIVMRPRGGDWLETDIARLQNAGIQTIVSTVEDWEAAELGLSSERDLCEALGMRFISYPLPDRSTPRDLKGFRAFVKSLAERLSGGEKIGVHCRGCIGRSTVVTASTLIIMGWTSLNALDAIEAARGCSIPDTEQQRDWIVEFGVSQ